MPTVEIFYNQQCPLCHKAMDYFRGRDIPFEAYEVDYDHDADEFVDSANTREMFRRCGQVEIVPQIFVNGRHVPGWRQLEPLIASGEIEALLAP